MDLTCAPGPAQCRTEDAVEQSETRKPRKMARIACRACRQAKSRCDVHSDRSTPCSRCRRLAQECRVDVIYKRVAKRAYDDLAQQLQQLQSVILDSSRSSPQSPTAIRRDVGPVGPSPDQTTAGPFLIHQTTQTPPASQFLESTAPTPIAETIPGLDIQDPTLQYYTVPENSPLQKVPISAKSSSATIARSIDSLTLTPEQIDELFQIYFSDYNPFTNLLDAAISPNDYYSRSAFLFWSVISVASRRYDNDPTLLSTLSPSVLALAWKTVGTLPHTPFVVEAIVLICTWPFPTSSMWTDASFMLITAAKSAAMQMGLHRPEYIQDFSRVERLLSPKGVNDAVVIWACCYIAAQRITSAFGQESIFKPDRVINRACEQGNIYSLPPSLQYDLKMARFSVYIGTLMSENTNHPFGLPDEKDHDQVMQQLENSLNELERQTASKATDHNRIQLCCTRLQVRVFYFFDTAQQENCKIGLLKAFKTASELIEAIVLADSSSNFLICAPVHYYRMLIVAGITLLKILNSSYSGLVDYASGKRNFNATVRLLRRCSLQDNDNFGRQTRILSQLWHFHQSSPSIKAEPPRLRVKTRSGASVLHDALWIWRRKYSKDGESVDSELTQGKDLTDLTASGTTSQAAHISTDPRMLESEILDANWMCDAGLTSWLVPGIDGIPLDGQYM